MLRDDSFEVFLRCSQQDAVANGVDVGEVGASRENVTQAHADTAGEFVDVAPLALSVCNDVAQATVDDGVEELERQSTADHAIAAAHVNHLAGVTDLTDDGIVRSLEVSAFREELPEFGFREVVWLVTHWALFR